MPADDSVVRPALLLNRSGTGVECIRYRRFDRPGSEISICGFTGWRTITEIGTWNRESSRLRANTRWMLAAAVLLIRPLSVFPQCDVEVASRFLWGLAGGKATAGPIRRFIGAGLPPVGQLGRFAKGFEHPGPHDWKSST